MLSIESFAIVTGQGFDSLFILNQSFRSRGTLVAQKGTYYAIAERCRLCFRRKHLRFLLHAIITEMLLLLTCCYNLSLQISDFWYDKAESYVFKVYLDTQFSTCL